MGKMTGRCKNHENVTLYVTGGHCIWGVSQLGQAISHHSLHSGIFPQSTELPNFKVLSPLMAPELLRGKKAVTIEG